MLSRPFPSAGKFCISGLVSVSRLILQDTGTIITAATSSSTQVSRQRSERGCGMRLSLFGTYPALSPREKGPRLCCSCTRNMGKSTRFLCLFVLESSRKCVPERNEEKFTLVSHKLSCYSSRGRASFTSSANDLIRLKILI